MSLAASLVYRDTKGSPLASSEGDANMRAIAAAVDLLTTGFDFLKAMGIGICISAPFYGLTPVPANISDMNLMAANAAINSPIYEAVKNEAIGKGLIIMFGAGKYFLNQSTHNGRIIVEGVGGEACYGTGLEYGTLLCHLGTSNFMTFQDYHELRNIGYRYVAADNLPAQAQTSHGIHVNIVKDHPRLKYSDGTPVKVGRNFIHQDVTTNRFGWNIYVENAFEWRISGGRIMSARYGQVRTGSDALPDGGDWLIDQNCQIGTDFDLGTIGVLVENSGGGKFGLLKFNGPHGTVIKIRPNYSNTPSHPDILKETNIFLIGAVSSENNTGPFLDAADSKCITIDGPIELASYHDIPEYFNFNNCQELVIGGSIRARHTNGLGTTLNIPCIANFNNNCTGTILPMPQDEYGNDATKAFINTTGMSVWAFNGTTSAGTGSTGGSGGGTGTTAATAGTYAYTDPSVTYTGDWRVDSPYSGYANGNSALACGTGGTLKVGFYMDKAGYFDLRSIIKENLGVGTLIIDGDTQHPITVNENGTAVASDFIASSGLLQVGSHSAQFYQATNETRVIIFDGFRLRYADGSASSSSAPAGYAPGPGTYGFRSAYFSYDNSGWREDTSTLAADGTNCYSSVTIGPLFTFKVYLAQPGYVDMKNFRKAGYGKGQILIDGNVAQAAFDQSGNAASAVIYTTPLLQAGTHIIQYGLVSGAAVTSDQYIVRYA